MDDKKDLPEQAGEKLSNIPVPERKVPTENQPVDFKAEKEMGPEGKVEKKDTFNEDKNISEGLKREIELMEVDKNLKQQAEQTANKIHSLSDDDKLKELLNIAKDKGVIYAIGVCKKMNDPYLLDTLHDMLAKEGYYQNFIKK